MKLLDLDKEIVIQMDVTEESSSTSCEDEPVRKKARVHRHFCEGCSLTLIQIVRFTEEEVVDFLITHCIFQKTIVCERCGATADLNKCTLNYVCCKLFNEHEKKTCSFKRPAYKNTILENSEIRPRQFLELAAVMLHLDPVSEEFISANTGIDTESVVIWSKKIREVFFEHQYRLSESIGGKNIVVEIEVANFNRSIKKSNQARCDEKQWVVGGIERGSKKIFLIPVESPDATSILLILEGWIKPGTAIVSDCFKTYECLKDNEFRKHQKENCLKFVNPDINNNTSTIKRVWRDIKSAIPECGTSKENFNGYIAEFQFKYRYQSKKVLLHEFFKEVARLY